jgi:hypothetical protein
MGLRPFGIAFRPTLRDMGTGAGDRCDHTSACPRLPAATGSNAVVHVSHPTIHGVPLNSAEDGTSAGDWTCVAPNDITLHHASNEYGGNEVADSEYAKAHCDAAGHRNFAVGAIAGALGIAVWSRLWC